MHIRLSKFKGFQIVIMESYCRLCAKMKRKNALKYKLSDVRWKLESCCAWEDTATENVYPQNVCQACFDQLEQSCQFLSAIKSAQQEIKMLIAKQKEIMQLTDPSNINRIDKEIISIKDEPGLEIDDLVNEEVNMVSESAHDVGHKNGSAEDGSTIGIGTGGTINAGKNHHTIEGDLDDCNDDVTSDNFDDDSGAGNCASDEDNNAKSSFTNDNCVEGDLDKFDGINNIGDTKNAASKQCAVVAVPESVTTGVSDNKYPIAETVRGFEKKETADVTPPDLSKKTTESRNNSGSIETVEIDVFPKRFVEKKDFLPLIPESARLVTGEIHPDKIAELNLVDWSEIKYICWKCHISCDTEKSLRAHFDETHPEIQFELRCSICASNKTSLTKDASITIKNLQVHVTNSHYPHLYYCCFKCHIYFWDRAMMKRHMKRVPHAYRPAERLLCQICSKTFTNEQSMRNHLRYIHEKKDCHYQCYLCKRTLKNFKTLRVHLSTIHVSLKKDEKNVCAVCGRICKNASALYGHMYSHNPADTVSCVICQKTFKSKYCLQKHALTHKIEKDLVCDQCEYRTRTPRQLVVHKRTHSDFKPLECDVCLKRFRHTGVLKIHKRTHTGEKPFKCSSCDYRSTCVSNIIKHTRRKHKA